MFHLSNPSSGDITTFNMQESLITPRYGACVVMFSNYLVVIGGQRSPMTVDNTVEVYSINRTEWKQLRISGNYQGAISASCAVFHQGERHGRSNMTTLLVMTEIVPGVTVLGGISSLGEAGHQMSSTVRQVVFNCPRRGWLCEEARPGGQAVAWHAGLGQVNSEVLVAGGRGDLGVSAAVYSSENHQDWTLIDQLRPARDQSASLVVPAIWREREGQDC